MQTIKLGSTGSAVYKWQTILARLGEPVIIDGEFGPQTDKATKRMQTHHNLVADGVVGPLTWAAPAGDGRPAPRMRINGAGIDLIQRWEGIEDGDPSTVNLDPYIDPVGIWTIGWGHAIRVNGRFLRGHANRDKARALYPGGINMEQARQLLDADLDPVEREVSDFLETTVTSNQFSALCSFAFNVGTTALARSSVLRHTNAGDWSKAAASFGMWNKGTIDGKKVVLRGLTRRREAESKLYLA